MFTRVKEVLTAVSPYAAAAGFAASIASTLTAGCYTDAEKVQMLLQDVRDWNEMYPCEVTARILSEYDERRKHETGNL